MLKVQLTQKDIERLDYFRKEINEIERTLAALAEWKSRFPASTALCSRWESGGFRLLESVRAGYGPGAIIDKHFGCFYDDIVSRLKAAVAELRAESGIVD